MKAGFYIREGSKEGRPSNIDDAVSVVRDQRSKRRLSDAIRNAGGMTR